jgi:hypothetical protein
MGDLVGRYDPHDTVSSLLGEVFPVVIAVQPDVLEVESAYLPESVFTAMFPEPSEADLSKVTEFARERVRLDEIVLDPLDCRYYAIGRTRMGKPTVFIRPALPEEVVRMAARN